MPGTGLPAVEFFVCSGPEAGFPAHVHTDAYQYAHKNFLHKTVHAGEAYGPESIFQAITDLHAGTVSHWDGVVVSVRGFADRWWDATDRIGHGLHLFAADMVKGKSDAPLTPDEAKAYVSQLVNYIADRRILVEVNLTSNLQVDYQLLWGCSSHVFVDRLSLKRVCFATDRPRACSQQPYLETFLGSQDQRVHLHGQPHVFKHKRDKGTGVGGVDVPHELPCGEGRCDGQFQEVWLGSYRGCCGDGRRESNTAGILQVLLPGSLFSQARLRASSD
jgi:hypothetical protein